MPEPDTAKVNPTVTPGGSIPMLATPGELGDTVGQALGTAGEVATKIHHDAVAEFNQTSVLDAHNKLHDGIQQALFDPKNGLLNQDLGKDAPGAVDAALTKFDDGVSKISSGLANDQQKQQFARMAQESRFQVQQHLNTYESRQLNQYKQQTTDATAKNAVVSAAQNALMVANSGDPQLQSKLTRAEAIGNASIEQIELGSAAITDNFKFSHPTAADNDPRLVEQLNAYKSSAHYGVLQSLLSQGKDQDASAYYGDHKDALIGNEADTAARQVSAGSTAGDALRKTPTYLYAADGQIKSRADVFDAINGDKDLQNNPKLYSAVTEQADRILQQHDQARREADQKTTDDSYALMKASPLGFNDPAVQAKIATLPPERQEWLRATDMKAQKLAAKQEAVPDNSDAYYSVMSDAVSDTIGPSGKSRKQEFIEQDLRQYKGLVSDGDYGKMVATQLRLRGKEGTSGEDDPIKGTMTPIEIVNNTLESNKITRNTAPGVINPKWTDFQRKVNSMVEAQGGIKKIGPEGVQKIADSLMVQTTVKTSHWFGGDTQEPGPREFERLPANAAFSASQIDQPTRARLIRAWQQRGIANPTDAQIFKSYLESVPNATAR